MQSLTYKERTESYDPGFVEGTFTMGMKLTRAIEEYRSVCFKTGESMGIEDFCCWLHNETAAERDVISGHSNPRY